MILNKCLCVWAKITQTIAKFENIDKFMRRLRGSKYECASFLESDEIGEYLKSVKSQWSRVLPLTYMYPHVNMNFYITLDLSTPQSTRVKITSACRDAHY